MQPAFKRTIRRPVEQRGKGLFLGKPCAVTLKPAEGGTGIRIRTPAGEIAAAANAVEESANFTYLKKDIARVYMVEHLLAALYGLRIGNLLIEMDSDELPILDGSALPWVRAIREAGLVEQAERWKMAALPEPLAEYEDSRFLGVFPGEFLRLGYYFSHAHPRLGRAYFEWTYDEAGFEAEIAPARTFATEEEWEAIKMRGLVKNVTGEEGVLFTADGPHTPLRFPNEPVRHKILDMIGDLSLSGVWVNGLVLGFRTGHRTNHRMAARLAAGGTKE